MRHSSGQQRTQASSHSLTPLLSAVASGDKEALGSLYEQTSAKLYGICLRLLRSEAEAEEILQDVYVTVWRKASLFDDRKASPVTWLSILARNKAIDRMRRSTLPTTDIESASEVEDGRLSALEVLEQSEEKDRLAECLGELEERHATAIRAAFFEGATYSELATRDSVPLGTMKSWIRRSLTRLRGCMER